MTELLEQRKNLHRRLEDSESLIRNLESQIVSTQKLATLGTMACIMAHEFNNILMPIINYAELAQREPDNSDLTRKALEKIVKNGQLASNMIENMLGFARNESQQKEEFPLLNLVQDCFLCLVRDLGKDGIQTHLEIPETMTVTAVRGQLQQVLLNMIINARQAMLERGGRLTLRGWQTETESIIEIADTGPGIAPEDLPHIFEPFYSTKTGKHPSREGGTGLGLMVCRNIISAHGGTIQVASTPGKGARFTIRLER